MTRRSGLCLNNLGNVLRDQGELTEARGLYQKSLKLLEQLGYTRGKAITLGNLGLVAHHEGELRAAP